MQPHTLKRTISKCSMDGDVACKKLSSGLDMEPVLLPRERAPTYPPLDEVEPEPSPTSPYLWGPTPPVGDFCATASSSTSPYAILPSETPASDPATDQISAARLVALVLDYLKDVAHYCNRYVNLSFFQLRQMLQSIPFAVGKMQSVVRARLELSWPLVAAFVQNVTEFISDEDIRDASVGELAAFLQSWQGDATTSNICANLFEFFHDVLTQFKQFLTKTWLQVGRISFPCEFGKKSDSLFLCMECHREHM